MQRAHLMGGEVVTMSNLEYHVLLSLASEALYGYAIKLAVEDESQGTIRPRAGSLYRVLARLMSQGLVRSARAPGSEPLHPGRERKYYALTREGKRVLSEETVRLEEATALARQRLKALGG